MSSPCRGLAAVVPRQRADNPGQQSFLHVEVQSVRQIGSGRTRDIGEPDPVV